jgi:DNA-binding GntR family transcriptional regulator
MARPKSDAVEIAFNFIRDQINRYELKPGDVVSDSAITLKLSMSRTPVREAIQLLVGAGLVERVNSKFLVTHIPYAVISDVFEIREAMELLAVRNIIRNGGLSEEQRSVLRSIHHNFQENLENTNLESNFHPDSVFHSTVVEFSGNVVAINLMKDLELRSERIRWLSILTPDRYRKSYKEHDLILNALEEGNLRLTEKFICQHISNSLDNYKRVTEIPNWENIIISIRNSLVSATNTA